jgi:putative oxidoreductase
MVRRLYSTFAGGWPGIGLLGMRLVVGSVLLVRAGPSLWSDPPWQATLTFASSAGPGLLLVIGLWTPLAGLAAAAIEISRILTSDDVFAPVLAATMGAALAMLGPGRWSIDAWLFGWKRIEASPRQKRPNSR